MGTARAADVRRDRTIPGGTAACAPLVMRLLLLATVAPPTPNTSTAFWYQMRNASGTTSCKSCDNGWWKDPKKHHTAPCVACPKDKPHTDHNGSTRCSTRRVFVAPSPSIAPAPSVFCCCCNSPLAAFSSASAILVALVGGD